jgi:hypothetical protein
MCNDITKSYKRLAASVVIQAARDYKKAFEEYIISGKDKKRMDTESIFNLHDCQKFFASDWFGALCDYDGLKFQKSIEKRVYKKLGFKSY